MERVLLADGVENLDDLKGKQIFTGLFGDELVMMNERKIEKPSIPVTTKLTKSENDAMEAWAIRCGISKYKFIRDCIRQQLKYLDLLTEP